MRIVGIEQSGLEDGRVHTIDLWYSARRAAWIVERLDHAGDAIGAAHCCESEQDAATCLAEWLRSHDETHLVSPHDVGALRKPQKQTVRRAA